MNDDKLNQFIDEAAERLNEPLEVPRDRMWSRIDAARAPRRSRRVPRRGGGRTVIALRAWWPAAAAALILIGVGVGRLTAPGVDPVPVATAPADPWSHAAGNVVQRAEALLAAFDEPALGAPVGGPVSRWAGLLLFETRRLMDSPAAEDPELDTLLADLELVLSQIVRLQDDSAGEDLDWIADGLKRRATLQRLRDRLESDAQRASL